MGLFWLDLLARLSATESLLLLLLCESVLLVWMQLLLLSAKDKGGSTREGGREQRTEGGCDCGYDGSATTRLAGCILFRLLVCRTGFTGFVALWNSIVFV